MGPQSDGPGQHGPKHDEQGQYGPQRDAPGQHETQHDGSQHLQHHVKQGYDSRYVQHDGSGQDLSDDQPKPDGPTERNSQHDVQQHDGTGHVGHDQQPNVFQH